MNILSVSCSSFCRTYSALRIQILPQIYNHLVVHRPAVKHLLSTRTKCFLLWNLFSREFAWKKEGMSCPFARILFAARTEGKRFDRAQGQEEGTGWSFGEAIGQCHVLPPPPMMPAIPPLSSASKTWNKNSTISPKTGFNGYCHDHDGKTTVPGTITSSGR